MQMMILTLPTSEVARNFFFSKLQTTPAPLGALSVIINITRERGVSGPVLCDFYTNLRQN